MVKRIGRKNMWVSIYRNCQVLQSYNEEVGIYLDKQNAVILTNKKFSNTTSKHKGVFTRMFPANTIVEVVSPEMLKTLIEKTRQKEFV